MIPSPYFSNVLEIGDLTIDYVFAEQDCPIIFTCKDKNDKIYFCVCVTMTNVQKWVLTKVSFNRLKEFINNRLSSYEMFKNSENKIFVLTWNYGYSKENCKIIASKDVTDDDLPQKNAFLDAYDDEFSDYIEIISNRIIMEKELSFIRQMDYVNQLKSFKPPMIDVAFDGNEVDKTFKKKKNPHYNMSIVYDTKSTAINDIEISKTAKYLEKTHQDLEEIHEYLKAS